MSLKKLYVLTLTWLILSVTYVSLFNFFIYNFKAPEDFEKKAFEALKKAKEIRSFQQMHINLLRISEKKKSEKTQKLFQCVVQSIEKLKKENAKLKVRS